jgi:DNA-binding winged helix-turn-helix (wHTH) protein
MTPKVFDTLLALLGSGGRVIEKEELIRAVWDGAAVEEVGLTGRFSATGERSRHDRGIVSVF